MTHQLKVGFWRSYNINKTFYVKFWDNQWQDALSLELIMRSIGDAFNHLSDEEEEADVVQPRL